MEENRSDIVFLANTLDRATPVGVIQHVVRLTYTQQLNEQMIEFFFRRRVSNEAC